jgi:hypothetical protein
VPPLAAEPSAGAVPALVRFLTAGASAYGHRFTANPIGSLRRH